MKRNLLTGDNIDGIGWVLADILTTMGFSVKRCSNLHSYLEKECAANTPDGLIFFVTSENEELYSFTEELVAKYVGMRIFVLSYIKSYRLRKQLEDIGITGYFLMPDLPSEICKWILADMLPDDERTLFLNIIEYLEAKGISCTKTGFYYMCSAMMAGIFMPRLLSRMTAGFYPLVAERMNSTPQCVDQSLRRFSKYITEHGVRFDAYKGTYPMTNTNLISSAIDEFSELYDIYK